MALANIILVWRVLTYALTAPTNKKRTAHLNIHKSWWIVEKTERAQFEFNQKWLSLVVREISPRLALKIVVNFQRVCCGRVESTVFKWFT